MTIHEVIANENVRVDSNKVAFEYGPIVYCAEEIDNKHISNIAIPDNIEVNIKERTVLTEKVIAIKGKINDEEFTLIPYYLWSNRGVGKMKVWFPKEN